MKLCELGEYKSNEYVTVTVESQFNKQLPSGPKKFFRASTGFEPMVSAFALQCSTSWPVY